MKCGVHVAERDPLRARRLELVAADLLDVEVALERRVQSFPVLDGHEPMGGKDGQSGVGERAEEHEDVVVLALAADLLGVYARGLVAVVAVRDQQLCVGQSTLELGDQLRVADAPKGVAGAVGVAGAIERLACGCPLEGPDGRPVGVGKEAEDGRQVRPRGTGQPQPVLLRPGMRALVRANPARPVILHAHAREEARAHHLLAARRLVLLPQRPQRRLALAHHHPLRAPGVERVPRMHVRIPAIDPGQVDLDDIERRPLEQRRPLLIVDHVIRRRDHLLERADGGGLVAKRPDGLNVGHGRATLAPGPRLHLPESGRGAAW